MIPGDVLLIPLPQIGGSSTKLRPALLLVDLPGPYQNLLLCGISSQLQNLQNNWDELIDANDPDFVASGLHASSIIRLSYLYAADPSEIACTIGALINHVSIDYACACQTACGLEKRFTWTCAGADVK